MTVAVGHLFGQCDWARAYFTSGEVERGKGRGELNALLLQSIWQFGHLCTGAPLNPELFGTLHRSVCPKAYLVVDLMLFKVAWQFGHPSGSKEG